MPGITNSPVRFSSFSQSAASSSKNSRDCVRFMSKRSAKCENNSDLPIFRASSIVSPNYPPHAGINDAVFSEATPRPELRVPYKSEERRVGKECRSRKTEKHGK